MKLRLIGFAVALLLPASPGRTIGAQVSPITGGAFAEWMATRNAELERVLGTWFADSAGYLVTGPLAPERVDSDEWNRLLGATRVVCADWSAFEAARLLLDTCSAMAVEQRDECVDSARGKTTPGFRGISLQLAHGVDHVPVVVVTIQQLRWLLWARLHLAERERGAAISTAMARYSSALSDYLHALDRGQPEPAPPVATEFGAPDSADYYRTPPDYVIQGYENYKAYLGAHAEVNTDFARGIIGFVPTDSTLAWFKRVAPREAYPNKEAAALPHEYRKYFERGGNPRELRTLTSDHWATLEPGEYFFAVNVSGTIRIGRERPREEVARIESETGRKVPRANHAFLFPGEPLLSAGSFWIECDPAPRITTIVANSGHYFYSNIQPTIREDIAERSDHYLLSLGHLFTALDAVDIDYRGALIQKF